MGAATSGRPHRGDHMGVAKWGWPHRGGHIGTATWEQFCSPLKMNIVPQLDLMAAGGARRLVFEDKLDKGTTDKLLSTRSTA